MAPDPALVVLDSVVVSMLFRRDEPSAYYRSEIEGRRSVISFQTHEEALFGAIRAGWGLRRMKALHQHLEQYEMVPSSIELVRVCAQLRSDREKVGRALSTADAWIAATALMLGCPLASHDGDFDGIAGLQLIRAPSP